MSAEFQSTSLHLIGLSELKKRSGGFIALGIVLVILGTIALATSVLFTMALMLFIGSLMIFVGILQAAHAVMAKMWGGFFLDLVIGLLNAAVGIVIVSHPPDAAAAITLAIALFLILGGVFRIGFAFAVRFHHVLWLVIHGAINILLGVLILQQWPWSGLWVIGLFVGIDMIFNGWSLIMLGVAAKRMPLQ